MSQADSQTTPSGGPGRWPRWVYGSGDEPDPRFSFANERTFLAWIRTSLALMAAGVALDAIPLPMPGAVQFGLAAAFIALGLLCAVASWLRWARAERAMRRGDPLPAASFGVVLSVVVVLSALGLLAAGLWR
ncbi:MAG: YidH family protein [Nocardioidaceae bacterium]